MPRYPDHIKKLMADYSLTDDEVWQVHGSTWVVKHKAIERIGARLGIVWERPQVLEGSTADKIVVVLVTGHIREGDGPGRSEWSFGEASPANNKNAYPWAMAEKRGKDRVILKFLAAHGDVYSEEEADDFKQSEAPKKSAYSIKRDTPDLWPNLEKAVRSAETVDALNELWDASEDQAERWPETWRQARWDLFEARTAELNEKAAA